MTLANFKSLVAAYVNRELTSLTSVNSQDILLQAINDARRAAQRDHDFELNRTEDCYLSTHAGGANWMTGGKTTPGGATACAMKRVDEIWNYGTMTIGATTYYPRTTYINYSYSGEFKRSLPLGGTNTVITNYATPSFGYAVGTQLFVAGVGSATIYKLVGIKWLDDLVDGDLPDIFLTYFTDWLKFATIAALNVYLKDSDRFPIDAAASSIAWNSVKSYDGMIANMGESATLD